MVKAIKNQFPEVKKILIVGLEEQTEDYQDIEVAGIEECIAMVCQLEIYDGATALWAGLEKLDEGLLDKKDREALFKRVRSGKEPNLFTVESKKLDKKGEDAVKKYQVLISG